MQSVPAFPASADMPVSERRSDIRSVRQAKWNNFGRHCTGSADFVPAAALRMPRRNSTRSQGCSPALPHPALLHCARQGAPLPKHSGHCGRHCPLPRGWFRYIPKSARHRRCPYSVQARRVFPRWRALTVLRSPPSVSFPDGMPAQSHHIVPQAVF